MDLSVILISLSLAMDAFSVSLSHGLENRSLEHTDALKMGVFFGSFQALMPILGWLAGINIIQFISGFDHWVAFGLLSLIGIRMILESTRSGPAKLTSSLSLSILLLLSIATSIDALAVGMSLSFLDIPIVTPAITIGVVTFSLSFLGVYLGNRFGRFLGKKIEVFGGAILILIGLRILFEHIVG